MTVNVLMKQRRECHYANSSLKGLAHSKEEYAALFIKYDALDPHPKDFFRPSSALVSNSQDCFTRKASRIFDDLANLFFREILILNVCALVHDLFSNFHACNKPHLLRELFVVSKQELVESLQKSSK